MTKRLTCEIDEKLHDYLSKRKNANREPIWKSVEEAIRLLMKKDVK